MPTEKTVTPRLRKILAVAQPVTKAEKSRAIQAAHRPVKPKTTIAIRRAVVTDAVNIYKQWLTEDARKNDTTEFDPAARVAYILTTIATGFVVVVEVSGRILGSVGFSAGGYGFNKRYSLLAVWGTLSPQIRRPEIIALISRHVCNFADSKDVDIDITVESPEEAEMWQDFDFTRVGIRLVRKADSVGENNPEEPDFSDSPEQMRARGVDPDAPKPEITDGRAEDPEDFGEFDSEDDDDDDPLSKRKDVPPKGKRTVTAQADEFDDLNFDDPE